MLIEEEEAFAQTVQHGVDGCIQLLQCAGAFLQLARLFFVLDIGLIDAGGKQAEILKSKECFGRGVAGGFKVRGELCENGLDVLGAQDISELAEEFF